VNPKALCFFYVVRSRPIQDPRSRIRPDGCWLRIPTRALTLVLKPGLSASVLHDGSVVAAFHHPLRLPKGQIGLTAPGIAAGRNRRLKRILQVVAQHPKPPRRSVAPGRSEVCPCCGGRPIDAVHGAATARRNPTQAVKRLRRRGWGRFVKCKIVRFGPAALKFVREVRRRLGPNALTPAHSPTCVWRASP